MAVPRSHGIKGEEDMHVPYALHSSRSAIRGYAKAKLYRVAGKVYSPSGKEYPPLE